MENNNWIEYKAEIRERLKAFVLKILELSELIPNTTRGKVINYQITKSGSSTYANYRAALRARSKAEFFSKLSIVVEEADETEMWLDLIISSNLLSDNFIKTLHNESVELLKILATMRKRIGD
ncbi:MAG: four helix bundle protein [Salinivirgaceae bacterium]|nr:four helix bundle protein [Salinivirgaceae bacterium]